MSKIAILVINYFNNYIGSFGKAKNKSKYALGGALILIVGVAFIFIFTSMAINTVETSLQYANDPTLNLSPSEIKNFLEMPLYVTTGMMWMFVMLLTITKGTSSKKHNDEDLLLSLPVKKHHIVISKILFNYLFDFGMILTTLAPSFIVYYIYMHNSLDIGFLLRFPLLLLLIPMLSNAIGSILGKILDYLTRKIVNASAIKSIISVVFLVLFLLGYYALQFYFELFVSTSDFELSSIAILRIIVDFTLGNNWIINGVIILISCFIPFVICVVVVAKSLGKHISPKSAKEKPLSFNKTSITKTLFQQEVGKYFGSNIYVINTLFGGAILFILSIMYIVVGEPFITSKIASLGGHMEGVSKMLDNVPLIVTALAIYIISTMVISYSSISFEGKNLWIIKVHPVSYRKVFISKIMCNFIVSSCCVVLSSLFFGPRFIIDHGSIGILYICIYQVILILFSLLISVVGLFVNLIFPKLDWQNENEIIKQSVSVGLGLLINIILGTLVVLPFIISIFLFNQTIVLLSTLISILVLLVLIILSFILLFTKGKKLYNQIM